MFGLSLSPLFNRHIPWFWSIVHELTLAKGTVSYLIALMEKEKDSQADTKTVHTDNFMSPKLFPSNFPSQELVW